MWVLGHVKICRLWVRHSPCCTLFLINSFGIEMVLCDLYLKRFDLTKGLSFDTVSITVWYKLCHYDHSALRARIIFTTNEFVDRTRNFKSDASQFKQKNMKNMRRRPDFFWNKMRRRQDLSHKMRPRPDFLTKSWWVPCPIDIACNLFFTNHSSEYSSFNWLINELINELINLWPSYSTVVFPTAVRSTTLCHWVGGSWREQSWPPIQWGILFESC